MRPVPMLSRIIVAFVNPDPDDTLPLPGLFLALCITGIAPAILAGLLS